MPEILVLYYSRKGSVKAMAELVCEGVESVPKCSARLRTVAPWSINPNSALDEIPKDGPPYANKFDLTECDGLIMGSPTRFGQMAVPLTSFLQKTGSEWLTGALSGKPAAVFTSTSTQHGGQESTLLSMCLPLLHHGMIICGLPFTEKSLNETKTGGTPYGASHVSGNNNQNPISENEKDLCRILGSRLAKLASAVKAI